MNTTTPQTTSDEQTTTAPLRFEITATWQRELSHPKDDPDRLKERLGYISVDGDVSVTEFGPTSATIVVEATVEDMTHSPGLFSKAVRRVFRNYNKRTIAGDSIHDIPKPRGVKAKYIRWAYEGKARPTGLNTAPKEAWEQAKAIAADLDLEGAESIVPTIYTRTIAGAEVDA